MTRTPRRAAAAIALLVAPAFLAAQGARDDLTTVGWHGDILRVAVSPRYVYAATPDGLIAFDRRMARWTLPITPGDGYPTTRVIALLADDADNAWLRTDAGWLMASPAAGIAPAPAPRGLVDRTLSPNALAARAPRLAAMGRLLTRDDGLRSWPIRTAAAAPDVDELWVGTAGGGLAQGDPLFARLTPQPFGLLGRGVGALARTADGVCVAPDGALPSRPGIACATAALDRWRWRVPAALEAWGAAARRMVVAEGAIWLLVPRGLVRIPLDGAAPSLAPVASDVVVADLQVVAGVPWIATARGLLVADGERGTLRPDGEPLPLTAIAAAGDTLWLGTPAGIVRRAPDGTREPLRGDPALLGAVTALALSDSLLFVGTRQGLITVSRASGAVLRPWPAGAPGAVAPVTRVAADARAVWVAGQGGVVALSRRTGVARTVRPGAGLPGPATDLVLAGDLAWIGTRGGLVRVRRPSDGLLP